jgi:chromosome segregation ATPase
MNRYSLWTVAVFIVISTYGSQASAEARRDANGGGQASKKAQYMIRQLHNEKQELQTKLAELQGKHDQLTKEHEKTKVALEQSSSNNDKLVSRVKGTSDKYKELAEKYREAVSILRKANMDNQYMVRAVQEREQWIAQCSHRNDDLYQANSDLLSKYGEAAGKGADPFFGIGTVELENEMQEYQFKLEDLQVTKFKPVVDAESHVRNSEVSQSSEAGAAKPAKVN